MAKKNDNHKTLKFVVEVPVNTEDERHRADQLVLIFERVVKFNFARCNITNELVDEPFEPDYIPEPLVEAANAG